MGCLQHIKYLPDNIPIEVNHYLKMQIGIFESDITSPFQQQSSTARHHSSTYLLTSPWIICATNYPGRHQKAPFTEPFSSDGFKGLALLNKGCSEGRTVKVDTSNCEGPVIGDPSIWCRLCFQLSPHDVRALDDAHSYLRV